MNAGLPGATVDSDLRMFKDYSKTSASCRIISKYIPHLSQKAHGFMGCGNSGNYAPLEVLEAVELLAKIKALLPMGTPAKIQRDIPAYQVLAGIRKSNIRQLRKSG